MGEIVTQRAVKVTVAEDAGVGWSEGSGTGGETAGVLVVVVGETAGEVTVFVEGSGGAGGERGRTGGGTGSVLEEIVTQGAVVVTVFVDPGGVGSEVTGTSA